MDSSCWTRLLFADGAGDAASTCYELPGALDHRNWGFAVSDRYIHTVSVRAFTGRCVSVQHECMRSAIRRRRHYIVAACTHHQGRRKANARQRRGEATNGHERQARQAKTSENGKPSACATPLRVSAKMLCTCIYLHVGTPLYLRKAHTPHSTASQRPQTTQTT